MTPDERMEELLELKDQQIQKLRNELYEYYEKEEEETYREKWGWVRPRTLSDEENLGLPVPRLELRWVSADEYNYDCTYSLVIRHLLGHIVCHPLGVTRRGGYPAYNMPGDTEEYIDTPFRDGAHLKHEMDQLDLPGFVVLDGKYKELKPKKD